MLDWYVLLVPLALLALVALFGFAGCSFSAAIEEATDPTLVSEWLLGESSGPIAADAVGVSVVDPMGANPGAYKTVTLAADPSQLSPATASPPFLGLGVTPGLQEGNTEPCVQVDGGYVEVPFDPSLNTPTFTIMGWVFPQWDPNEMVGGGKPFRCVAVSREFESPPEGVKRRGLTLYAGPDEANPSDLNVYWQAWIGTGLPGVDWQKLLDKRAPVQLGATTHLAMTYDGTTLKLYVHTATLDMGLPQPELSISGYAPSTTNPLYIGMGGTEQPAPLFPFKGKLQHFKCYNVAVDAVTIDNHIMARMLSGN